MIIKSATYSFGWLYQAIKGSAVRRFNSFNNCKSKYALAGGMYVSAASWQDPPTAPPRYSSSQKKYKKLAMEDDQNAKSMRRLHAARRDRRNAQ